MANGDNSIFVVDRVDRGKHPPHGGWIVWNPIGENRLRTECGPINVPSRFPGGLTRREVFLTLDDVPLIRRQSTGCPTCEQLMQVGCGSEELAATYAEAINQLTIEVVRGENADWLTTLTPLFRLLPRGVYLVSLDEYFPTDGHGHFFWSQFQSLQSFPALSACINLSDRPCFLAPTQPANKFQRRSFTQAQRDYRTKPGLALKLDCKVSALLDGHHRALCAALNRERVICLTLSRRSWIPDSKPQWRSQKSSEIRHMIESESALAYEPWREVEQPRIDEFVRQLESLPRVALPPDVLPTRLDTTYPDLDAVTGLDVISGKTGTIADEQVEAIIAENRREHFHYNDLVPYLLKALFGYRDPRAVGVGIRIARDLGFRVHWELAFKLLATRRCEKVDDFFVESLCARDQPARPEITEIIDDYFRKANPSAE